MTNQQKIDRVRVKVCGLTNAEDARAALEAGADLLGFIFYKKSPRYVSPDAVREMIAKLTDYDLRITDYVGVFVNMPAPRIAGILDFCGLDLAQLHGEEGPDHFAGGLAGRAFKALRPRSEAAAEAAAAGFAGLGPPRGPDLLVDAYHPALRGGTGEVADWRLAAGLAREHRLLLAGGLTPTNVAQAIQQVQPWGVDVSSGVEAEPGRKDHDKVRAFVEAVIRGQR